MKCCSCQILIIALNGNSSYFNSWPSLIHKLTVKRGSWLLSLTPTFVGGVSSWYDSGGCELWDLWSWHELITLHLSQRCLCCCGDGSNHCLCLRPHLLHVNLWNNHMALHTNSNLNNSSLNSWFGLIWLNVD